MYIHCSKRPEEGVLSPGTGVRDWCKPPRGCWESDSDAPEEQSVLSTSEPSLQPQMWAFKINLEHLGLRLH